MIENYNCHMFIVQAAVATLVNYSRNNFIVKATTTDQTIRVLFLLRHWRVGTDELGYLSLARLPNNPSGCGPLAQALALLPNIFLARKGFAKDKHSSLNVCYGEKSFKNIDWTISDKAGKTGQALKFICQWRKQVFITSMLRAFYRFIYLLFSTKTIIPKIDLRPIYTRHYPEHNIAVIIDGLIYFPAHV